MEKGHALPTLGVLTKDCTLQTGLSDVPRRVALKDLLASAPLEGVDLERARDIGREVAL